MPTAEELFEKYDAAFSAQVELEAEMDRIMEAAENRGEAEKQALKGIVHDINAARGEVNKAWREYNEAVNAEHAAEEEALAKLQAELDELDRQMDEFC